jgi:DNA mismatch repair protein MutH
MVRVDQYEVITLAQKEMSSKILWMTSTEQKMILLIDYEKNLIV